MITGRQIRKARAMLGWQLEDLSLRANVSMRTIAHAELTDEARGLTPHQTELVRQAFTPEGLRFGRGGGVLFVVGQDHA